MAINVDWVRQAAEAICYEYKLFQYTGDGGFESRSEDLAKIRDIIERWCPFKRDVAYQEVRTYELRGDGRGVRVEVVPDLLAPTRVPNDPPCTDQRGHYWRWYATGHEVCTRCWTYGNFRMLAGSANYGVVAVKDRHLYLGIYKEDGE